MSALELPTSHCCMLNRFANRKELDEYLALVQPYLSTMPHVTIPCYIFAKPDKQSTPIENGAEELQLQQSEEEVDISLLSFPRPVRDSNQVYSYYLLDAASVLAVEAMDITSSDMKVLDLCAAPGGKSVALIQKLFAHTGSTLHCNERSDERRKRLQKVIADYVPLSMRSRVSVTGYDGTVSQWFKKDLYDKVLVDAPCSSDRHVLHDRDQMVKWTPALTKEMHQKQYLLLLTALSTVKPGGTVVYGTCSLSQLENDDVIEKALGNKFGLRFEVVKKTFAIGEPTKHGWIVLPDKGGWGPLYFAILKKETIASQEPVTEE